MVRADIAAKAKRMERRCGIHGGAVLQDKVYPLFFSDYFIRLLSVVEGDA
jgi:hypothetical protein